MGQLSQKMRAELRELKRRKDALAADPNDWGGGGTKAGNTNATMNALEKRGLVAPTYPQGCHPWVPLWVITDAGEVAL